MNADGSGLQRLTSGGSLPAWSPDGQRIAFSHGTSAARATWTSTSSTPTAAGEQKLTEHGRTPVLVARRPEDRLHEAAAAVLPQLRHLRHERRRQRAPAPCTHDVCQQSSLVSRRAADRVRPRLRHLGDERRRKRAAQAHKRCARAISLRAGRQTDGRSPSIAVSEGGAPPIRGARHRATRSTS